MNIKSIPKLNYKRDILGVSCALIIPLVPEDEIISFVENTLGKIPRITWVRNKVTFTITHYKIEGLFINEQEPLHRDKHMTIHDAVETALEKFPHNRPNIEYLFDDNQLPGPYMRGGYCKIEISLFYDDENECYVFGRKRLKGDGFSTSVLFGTLGYELKNNILWMTRKHYISLTEGLQMEAGKEDQISKYLFNELICKEVCSYMSDGISQYKPPVQSSSLIDCALPMLPRCFTSH
jgi:hypothetical protein